MYAAIRNVGRSMIVPVWANVPMKGGRAPTIAPTKVFAELFCFIGRYIQR